MNYHIFEPQSLNPISGYNLPVSDTPDGCFFLGKLPSLDHSPLRGGLWAESFHLPPPLRHIPPPTTTSGFPGMCLLTCRPSIHQSIQLNPTPTPTEEGLNQVLSQEKRGGGLQQKAQGTPASSASPSSGNALSVDAASNRVSSGHTRSGEAFSSHGVPSYVILTWVLKCCPAPCLSINRQDLGHHCPLKGLLFSGPHWVVLPYLNTFLTSGVFLSQASDEFGSMYPMLTGRSTHPVFHLPDLHPQASATTVSSPTLTGVRSLSLSTPFSRWCRAGHGCFTLFLR